MYGGFSMIKIRNKKSEIDQIIEYILKEGFTEITPEEKESPEFRDSILRSRQSIKEHVNSRKKKVKL
jgi:hypothetical protein